MKGLFTLSHRIQSTASAVLLPQWAKRSLLAASIGLMGALWGTPAGAEGTAQWGLNQPLLEYGTVSFNPAQTRVSSASRALYVDILAPGEVINISVCGASNSDTIGLQIYQTTPNSIDPAFTPTTSNQVLNQSFTSNLSCTDPLTGTLTSPVKFTAPAAGTYEIRLTSGAGQLLNRVDVTVTPDLITPVNPTERQGRLHSYVYAFNAGSFALSASTSTDYYIKVPGGRPGENFVWLLDLNNFAGFVYDIVGNSYGVDAPNSGFSVPQSGNSVTPEYPIYLSHPANAGPRPTLPPALANLSFVDDQGVDNSISPGSTTGVQDSGTFTFTTDIVGNYSVQIDVNKDGIFSPLDTQGNASGDVFLNGVTNGAGVVSVPWNGRTNTGVVLPDGTYDARIEMRAGEYHFIAGDAETSGGGSNNGLTIFESFSQVSSGDTLVFWDDATFLGGTTTLPNGALSSTPQARHTWGNFTGDGFGNVRYIDTYVYGSITTATTPVVIGSSDILPGIDVSGQVWNDADGSANNTFTNINTGAEPGTNAGGLHAILVDSSGNVIATAPVAADGTYTLTGVETNQNNVTLILSTTTGTVGQPAPTANVPTGWRGTSPLTTAAFNVGTNDMTGRDFGINVRNPDLISNYCQTSRDFLFVLDDSSSVDSTEVQQQRDAVMVMLQHLARNGIAARAAIVGFDSANRTVIDYTDVTSANLNTFQTALNNNYGVPGSGTNWEAGFQQGSALGVTTASPDVVFFFSDGKSNSGSSPIDEADQFKLAGAHVYGVWIDSDVALTVDDFKSVTDGAATLEFDGSNASSADYVKVANYGALPPKMTQLLQGACPGKPNLLLVKRITQRNGSTVTENGDNLASYINEPGNAYDDNTIENLYPPANFPDTDKWPTPNTFLLGGINGGNVKPNDELEYTIYFLSAGDSDANNVLFCDRIPENVTYMPTAYSFGATAGTQYGIQLNLGGTVTNLTGTRDTDAGQFFPIGVEPSTLFPGINCGGSNTNGAVVVNLGNLPKATAPATPVGSYGFVRFKGKVK